MTRIEKLKKLNNADVNELLALVETMMGALDKLLETSPKGLNSMIHQDLINSIFNGSQALAAYDKFNEVEE